MIYRTGTKDDTYTYSTKKQSNGKYKVYKHTYRLKRFRKSQMLFKNLTLKHANEIVFRKEKNIKFNLTELLRN